jgi:hypothetical protein
MYVGRLDLGRCGGKNQSSPKKKLIRAEEREKKKKVNLSSPPWLAQGQGRDEKGRPMSAPSIHISALVGAGSL